MRMCLASAEKLPRRRSCAVPGRFSQDRQRHPPVTAFATMNISDVAARTLSATAVRAGVPRHASQKGMSCIICQTAAIYVQCCCHGLRGNASVESSASPQRQRAFVAQKVGTKVGLPGAHFIRNDSRKLGDNASPPASTDGIFHLECGPGSLHSTCACLLSATYVQGHTAAAQRCMVHGERAKLGEVDEHMQTHAH